MIAGCDHGFMLADGTLMKHDIILDEVGAEEEDGAGVDEGAYAGRGEPSWECHDAQQ